MKNLKPIMSFHAYLQMVSIPKFFKGFSGSFRHKLPVYRADVLKSSLVSDSCTPVMKLFTMHSIA